jgi:hypothetical protein
VIVRRGLFASVVAKHLVAMVALVSTDAMADACKPIRNALAKQASTPVRVVMTKKEWDAKGQCSVTASAFRKNVGGQSHSPAEIPAEIGDVGEIPANVNCREVGRGALDGEVVEHYYAANGARGTDRHLLEFWISPETGLILKRQETRERSELTLKYYYGDAGPPFFW